MNRKTAAKKAPSFPYLTDQYEPTNPALWEKVKEVARGDKRSLTLESRIINAPSGYTWPSPPASAWAVKQYNGFGGGWRKVAALKVLEAGGIVLAETDEELACMQRWASQGFAQKVGKGCWESGPFLVCATSGENLRRKMEALLRNYNEADANALGDWIEANFRINSPKTPRGMKELKDTAQKMVWVLKFRLNQSSPSSADSVRDEVAADWAKIEPELAAFAAKFTDEGGTVVPKELSVGGTTYVNKAGLTEANLRKYVKRLGPILSGLKGWRSKAVSGGLKVVLASPKDFRGTAGGSYKSGEDTLYVRATPAVLKRGAGYGSFEYILVHELGHRYDKLHGTGHDFDRPEWWTTRYSQKEGFGFSEAFAELFALGHFNLQGNWNQDTVDRFERLMSTGKIATNKPLDPKGLRAILDKAVSRIRDYPTKVRKFSSKRRGEGWVVEALVEYKYPTSKVPVQKGKEPLIAPLRMTFKYDSNKPMSLRAEVKSLVLGTTKKVYENHRITGDYERTIRSVLLSYQPEIVWK